MRRQNVTVLPTGPPHHAGSGQRGLHWCLRDPSDRLPFRSPGDRSPSWSFDGAFHATRWPRLSHPPPRLQPHQPSASGQTQWRCHPDAWRLWLCERFSGRAHLPRCACVPDLRRHQRRAENHHPARALSAKIAFLSHSSRIIPPHEHHHPGRGPCGRKRR